MFIQFETLSSPAWQNRLRGTATIDRGSEADLGSIMVIWGFNIFLAFRDLNNRFQKKS